MERRDVGEREARAAEVTRRIDETRSRARARRGERRDRACGAAADDDDVEVFYFFAIVDLLK
jgi:hypothetical protein